MKKSKATFFFNFYQKNPEYLQQKLKKIFFNKTLKVKDISLLKRKQIVGNQYKITGLLELENIFPEKIVLEIHDNTHYFQRNLYFLSFLKNIAIQSRIEPAQLYGFLKMEKTIVREYIEGKFLHNLIEKGELEIDEIKNLVKRISFWLAKLHSLNIKKLPKALTIKLNRKFEKIILWKTKKFLKPNIEILQPTIIRNLKTLLKKMEKLEEKNSISLIHGDHQLANYIYKSGSLKITDFDTLELGNPARDLGRFLFRLGYSMERGGYRNQKIKKMKELFLTNYQKYKKIDLYPDLKTNIDCYQAEMIQYFILGMIWGENVPEFKIVEKLLEKQSQFLL